MLTQVCASEFLSGDRSRGSRASLQKKVRLTRLGKLGATATAKGSYGEEYALGVDFSKSDDGQLGVSCDCPRFQGGDPCKHLWAFLSKIDETHAVLSNPPSKLQLHEVDPNLIQTGGPLAEREPARSSPRSGEPKKHSLKERGVKIDEAVKAFIEKKRVASAAATKQRLQAKEQSKKQAAPAKWKEVLRQMQDIAQPADLKSSPGIPSLVFEERLVQKQFWFVVSLADLRNHQALSLRVFQSQRKRDGNWAIPASCKVSPTQLDPAMTDIDLAVLAALQPCDEVNQYNRYRSCYEPSYERLSLDPSLINESLVALQATGRFAWKLGDGNRFEDAKPIASVDTGDAWKLALTIQPSVDKASQLVVQASLIRDQVSLPISSVMLASDAGCAIVQLLNHRSDCQVSESTQDGLTQIESPPINAGMIRIDPDDASMIRHWQRLGKLVVPRRSINTLMGELSQSHRNYELWLAPSLEIPELVGDPAPRCLLHQREHSVASFDAELLVSYGDEQFSFDSSRSWWFDSKEKTVIRRNRQAEAVYLASVETTDFRILESSFDSALQVPKETFISVVEKLQEAGWEVLADGVKTRIATDFNISVSSGVDWFDLHADASFDGVTVMLPELLAAMRNGDRTILLDDGTIGMLPESWLQRFARLSDSGQTVEDGLRFGRSQALLLDVMLAEQENVKRDHSFTKLCKQLKSFDGIKPTTAPKTFIGQLREYQEIGLGWFQFLQKFGFGGCLADDMGLGKTIQVLAMLEQRRTRRLRKDEQRKPSLVVVPKSLVFNWIDEATKFSPKLKLINHTGLERRDQLEHAMDPDSRTPDVIVTTYGTLRNDIAILKEISFDYVILDEAQAIKNPQSLSAKSVRLIQGDHKLAMTGTPVENHLGDLWSLFDFLNPGMLTGTSKNLALDDDQNRQKIEQISQSLRPFILRRTKQQVLTELPEKMEQTLVCQMSKPQLKIYKEVRTHYQLHLSKKVEELGLKRSKIHVLEALLRLRQIACDPRLVDPASKVSGAKIDQLMKQLEEILSEGHKVLVFSQFTKLLGLVRNEINDRNWDHEYLDGKTRHRDKCVQRFQENEDCQLFLISLKAGGHGLNLTAADYVFILDPWWNPAVEAQAIDRAHRMGQTKSVMAYRMICSDTVEEKIIELQRSKKDLANAIISQDKSLISGLTADDLQQLLM